ncbi:MAG TPA: SIS domain-containing protein [Candidatus Dormibacteraeota bacterium]|jgi:D-sedoheptulose 7-phosphate isomerase|nr:SIS domain-containing protein [Candidatus Dormibacteraeota bacterium]
MSDDRPPVRTGWDAQLDEYLRLGAWLRDAGDLVAAAADLLLRSLGDGGRILACGNGGSSLEAQHFTAELVGRFRLERRPLAGIALSADGGAVTGIANDYGYDQAFARQIHALGRPGDALLALSTSGRSPSAVAAAEAARELGLRTVALTGEGGGPLAPLADVAIRVPSTSTARIQEVHLLVIHLICERIDAAYVDA